MFYVFIWKCLKAKSSLSRVDGQEKKICKKVTVANLGLYEKKLTFKHIFGPNG